MARVSGCVEEGSGAGGRLMLRNVVLTFVEGPRLGLSLSHHEECR